MIKIPSIKSVEPCAYQNGGSGKTLDQIKHPHTRIVTVQNAQSYNTSDEKLLFPWSFEIFRISIQG